MGSGWVFFRPAGKGNHPRQRPYFRLAASELLQFFQNTFFLKEDLYNLYIYIYPNYFQTRRLFFATWYSSPGQACSSLLERSLQVNVEVAMTMTGWFTAVDLTALQFQEFTWKHDFSIQGYHDSVVVLYIYFIFIHWLVVWNIFFLYFGNNHPNWLSYFQRGRYTTNQWCL